MALTAAILVAVFIALFTVTTWQTHASGEVAKATATAAGGIARAADPVGLASADPGVVLRTPDTGTEMTTGSTLAGGQMAEIRWDADTGVPAFLSGPVTPPSTGSPAGDTLAFFDKNKETFRMTDPASEFTVERQEGDALGMVHLKLAQVYRGVPVFGAEMSAHLTADGKIQAINGHYVPGVAVSVDPDVDVDAATATALADFRAPARPSSFEPPQLVVLTPGGTASLLTWKITLANEDPPVRMVYFVDAHSGKIVSRYNALEAAKNRLTYTAGNGTTIPGTLLITEGGSSGDAVAQAAHTNAGATYDYYFNTFGRDSFNNAGATITSSVHYSSGYNNAFWNGQQMVYGDGDGNVFAPLAYANDVVAHELTHAVTQYTANLVYSYQSGALNESYSDVFGAMVDRDDWLMGEDVYTPSIPGDALRSLSSPSLYGQPEHMNSYVNTSSDNGGVHTNSGIPNKAAYNVATALGKNKMEQIWYRTLTLYLNSSSEFNDARDASVQAATDLYGAGSPEVAAVQNGFAAVGINGTTMSTQTARIEINHTYRGDLVVTLGVGDPNAPVWSTIVSNRTGGSAQNIYTTVDISAAASKLPPSWQNRWFLKVYDAAAQDTGSIVYFAITDNGTTYTATDTPVPVNDFQTSYSYVPTTDVTPPDITNIQPSGTIYTANATISASYADYPSGVNTASVAVRLDGNAVPGCTVTAASVSCPSSGLAVGSHTISVDAADNVGNAGTASGSFQVVDNVAPVITSPAPTGSITSNKPTISASYSDAAPSSGVNTAAVTVSVDGAPLAGCLVSSTAVSCPSGFIADGAHQVTVSVGDNAGNTGSTTWNFTILGGPIVTDRTPADSSVVNNPTTPVTASWVKKNAVDINAASVRVYIDGVLKAAPAVNIVSGPDTGSFSYQPAWSSKFANGSHTARLVVADVNGVVTDQSWTFTVVSPSLSLSVVKVYWGGYRDYVNRDLTVNYNLANSGGGTARTAQVEKADISSGVTLTDTLPFTAGDIAGAGTASLYIRYHVPAGVQSFRVFNYVSCGDDGGNIYWYPAAPAS